MKRNSRARLSSRARLAVSRCSLCCLRPYALGIGGVLLAALLASIAPAGRAARVNPIEALRYE